VRSAEGRPAGVCILGYYVDGERFGRPRSLTKWRKVPDGECSGSIQYLVSPICKFNFQYTSKSSALEGVPEYDSLMVLRLLLQGRK